MKSKIWVKALGISLGIFILISAHAQTVPVLLGNEEYRFYELINKVRQNLGLPILGMNQKIQNAAIKHSEWMAKNKILSHSGPTSKIQSWDRMLREGYTGPSYGENVACGFSTANEAFKGWARSPDHLPNMISPHFYEMGIARAGTQSGNCPIYWTNDFGSSRNMENDPPEITDTAKINWAFNRALGEIFNPVSPRSNAFLRCTIPASLGKNLIVSREGLDTLIEANSETNGSYTLTLTYYSDAVLTNDVGLSTGGISIGGANVVRSGLFPLVTLVSPLTTRTIGFSISVNSITKQAQFDANGVFPAVSGMVNCSLKE